MLRVEVATKSDIDDVLGESVRREVHEDLAVPLESVRVIDVYSIRAPLAEDQLARVADSLLTDPIVQVSTWRGTLAAGFDRLIEVGFRPGVTDNVGRTTTEGIEDLLGIDLGDGESVHTSKLYLLMGPPGGLALTDAQSEHIAVGLLANPLIEYHRVWNEPGWRERGWRETPEQFVQGEGGEAGRPGEAGRAAEIAGAAEAAVAEIDLAVSDDELMAISREGVLSLSLEEMRRVRGYFDRPDVLAGRRAVGLSPRPTDVELEMIAQTWSEHCKHKIFNSLITYEADGSSRRIDSLFKTYIAGATEKLRDRRPWLVSVFTDNAGVIDFDGKHNLVFKVETHNHPSALDPYGGAITGIVGVNRDPMGTGLGADLIFNTDVFCFGPPDFPEDGLPKGILHPKRIFRGVRRGVEHGGNKMGIPTVNGTIVFDEAYVYNPLVYCGTGGIMPKTIAGRPSHEKHIEAGDVVVMVGGRIGKDGIHGATFSSVKLEETTSSQAVQIGAPIVQKKMMDALREARDLGLYRAITDNGAGGLSSSVGEMAELSGGCLVDVEKAPLKYPGLAPWELWVSEAQERMTVAVPPERLDEFMDLCRRRDVEATALGEFTSSGKVHVKYGLRTAAYLDMEFLHGGLPRLDLAARWRAPSGADPEPAAKDDYTADLMAVLAELNVCSKEWVVRQYDHEVQAQTLVKPMVGAAADGPSDAAVLRPVYDSPHGVVVSSAINPRYGVIDPYHMAASCIDEAIRNAVAVGANPDKIALLDNFCWGNPILSSDNPDGDYKLAQLVRAAQGCHDAAVAFGAPFISGKDSFHNEYELGGRTQAIPPTLLISAIGVIDDCGRAVTMDAKSSGDVVYVIGGTRPEMGGSVFLRLAGQTGVSVPRVDLELAPRVFAAVHRAASAGLMASCHDCSDGGLAVALAETAFAGGLGMEVELSVVPQAAGMRPGGGMQPSELLFSESNTRFVVTVRPEDRSAFEETMKGVPFARAGRVRETDLFRITVGGRAVVESRIGELKEAWQRTLRW